MPGKITNSAPMWASYDRESIRFCSRNETSCWLSRGKVLSRVAELVNEVAVFRREHGSVELATLFDDNTFQLKVFYLVDIFSVLNELSYYMQGKTNLR